MSYYRLQLTHSMTHYILLTSDIDYSNFHNKPNPSHHLTTRQTSQLGTDSYNRSLRRAFSRAKQLAFFNPDLTHFITLTYKQNLQDPTTAIQDIKNLIKHQKKLKQKNQTLQQPTKIHKNTESRLGTLGSPDLSSPSRGTKSSDQLNHREPIHRKEKNKHSPKNLNHYASIDGSIKSPRATEFKYIYVLEVQKRGAIHVHMVCNDWLETEMINGRLNVLGWQQHGFSDVKTILNTDNNFKPYLYLFKYMQKAQRIGNSFIHVSRNFDKISTMDYSRYITTLSEVNLLYKEDYEFTVNNKSRRITKEYLKAIE